MNILKKKPCLFTFIFKSVICPDFFDFLSKCNKMTLPVKWVQQHTLCVYFLCAGLLCLCIPMCVWTPLSFYASREGRPRCLTSGAEPLCCATGSFDFESNVCINNNNNNTLTYLRHFMDNLCTENQSLFRARKNDKAKEHRKQMKKMYRIAFISEFFCLFDFEQKRESFYAFQQKREKSGIVSWPLWCTHVYDLQVKFKNQNNKRIMRTTEP